jgi:hypothetical protein
MKRRASYIAAGITAAIVLLVGLGAYRQEGRAEGTPWDPCEEIYDVQTLFEMNCNPEYKEGGECWDVPEEYGDACQAGCVMKICPAQVPCTGLDPVFCTPCEDMKGARFWSELRTWEQSCVFKQLVGRDFGPRDKWKACVQSEMEQHCPALVGKDWSRMMGLGYWGTRTSGW